MAKQIKITRGGSTVTFETVSITPSELIFWTNEDTQAPHWPSLTTNQLGAAPSPNSSATPVTVSPNPIVSPPLVITYSCKIGGHGSEQGIVNVFNEFQAASSTALQSVKRGTSTVQTVATGGKSPYSIDGQQFEVTNAQGQVIASGSGPGPGLTLGPIPTANSGIQVSGAPQVVGTYTFTFNATDAMGLNVQQSQFTLVVTQ
jgi:hypothetical protein